MYSDREAFFRSFNGACSRELDEVRPHDTREFFCSRFCQMLRVATHAAAKEVRINSRIVKRHYDASEPGTFGINVNLRRARGDQKDRRGSNSPDLLRALPVSFHCIN